MLNVANINSDITIEKNENYDLYKNNVSLKMDIASIYNYNNTNNNIEARLVYNGIRLTASTNFIFIKEGEIGSNGIIITHFLFVFILKISIFILTLIVSAVTFLNLKHFFLKMVKK